MNRREFLAATGAAVAHAPKAAISASGIGTAKDFTEFFGIDKTDLSSTGRNRYFVLEPGYQLVLEGKHGSKSTTLTITGRVTLSARIYGATHMPVLQMAMVGIGTARRSASCTVSPVMNPAHPGAARPAVYGASMAPSVSTERSNFSRSGRDCILCRATAGSSENSSVLSGSLFHGL